MQTHRFKNTPKRLIRNPILKRNINRIPPPPPPSFILLRPRSREILPKFVKTTRHYTIGRIKCFFDAVSVMAVDVDVEDAGVGA